MKKYFILQMLTVLILVSSINAQDSKPIVKPKTTQPATATKPPAVKTQPKTNTTQTDNKYSTVTDIDGNVYKTIKIGNQIWMAQNLKTTRYNDGTLIPNVTDNNEWKNLTTGAYCYYDNDYKNNAIYGKLYNWYAVGTGKLAPKGWHIADDKEWLLLINHFGGKNIAGSKMKGKQGWGKSKNEFHLNKFNVLPAGYRNNSFGSIGDYVSFWSSDGTTFNDGRNVSLSDNNSVVYTGLYIKYNGFSIRCIKD